ncbi:MAG: exo-alpha-sialidase [Rubripirellula sp.]|nr:exo-alpha-sialidase [Rubripirellula sp.]
MNCRFTLFITAVVAPMVFLPAADPTPKRIGNSLMLSGDWVPNDPHQIDYQKLPRVPSRHVVISDVKAINGVNQHNYLAFHNGRFFVMWSDGPGVEDRVGQRVKFATSGDGLKWSESHYLTPEPPGSGLHSPYYGTRTEKGMRWISRGFWQREGELLALCSLDEAAGFFGPSLQLRAFRWTNSTWEDAGLVADNAINNFPPKKIATGSWMMSRRTFDYKKTGVQFLLGGVKAIEDWTSSPVLGTNDELSAEEPLWWSLPDGRIIALFRDNRGSKFLYRSVSKDQGASWTTPVRTNFPDATSKLFGFRLSDGRYVLISNSNPRARDPLTIAISEDGLVFNKLAWLVGGRHIDYPHALEHDGHLLVAFAGGKQSIEILKIELSALADISMPESVQADQPLSPIRAKRARKEHWIDLGDEGRTLYANADLVVPELGKLATFSLATASGEKRVVLAVDKKGHLTAELYGEMVIGPKLEASRRHSLLIRLHSHRDLPDELFVALEDPRKDSTEPTNWTLSNTMGSSNANLSRVILYADSQGFTNVRVATTREALATAKAVTGDGNPLIKSKP